MKNYFIMANSDGIQEEGLSIWKPALVLRENEERPKTVKSGIEVIEEVLLIKFITLPRHFWKIKKCIIKWQKFNIFMVKEIQALLFLK